MRFGIAVCVIDAENIHRIWDIFALVGSFLGANSLDETFSPICVRVVANPIEPNPYVVGRLDHVQAPRVQHFCSIARIPFLGAVAETVVDDHRPNAGWISVRISSTLLLLPPS